ncbi:MAG: FHA domain-containing protein [Chloroflexota bacterium]|nr:FHA domain-containing protein [Chloroflexota bacterium]
MERHTSGTERVVGHGKQRHANAAGSAVLCLVLCLTVIAAALVIFGGSASATKGSVLDVQGIPAAQGTAPGAVNTGIAQPLQTGGITGPVASVGPAGGNQGATAGTQSGGGFPLWVLVPVLLGLILIAVFVARRRPTVAVATTAAPPSQRPYTGTTTSTSATTTTTTATAPVAAAGAAGATGAASQVVCPNCGATNELSENFCHDCGQDLRATRAQMFAPAVDVVDEYTPYLETLNRVDEQLEYVLSRARVTVGSAPGNDIVVDAGFNGSATVSGVHAELRRDGEGFVIADRGSETGVYVNGEKVTEATLKDNDQVRVGDVQFVYHAPLRP